MKTAIAQRIKTRNAGLKKSFVLLITTNVVPQINEAINNTMRARISSFVGLLIMYKRQLANKSKEAL